MQYPPRRLTDRNGNLVDDAKVGATILETVPPREVRDECAYDLVHFDLDTQNSKDQGQKLTCPTLLHRRLTLSPTGLQSYLEI